MPWEKQFNVDEILEQAMRAFWARGYEATSMQDLVDCTGVNRGSLYATYGDKRELFIAALRRYTALCEQTLVKIEVQVGPRAAIRRVFDMFIEPVREGATHGCFLTNTALELAAHDKEVGKLVAHAQAHIESYFARMIVKAKSLGQASPAVDPAPAARALLATLIGLAVLSRSRPDAALLRTIADEAMKRLD